MSKGADVMKSKINIKIVISIVSVVILMFAAGCTNTNKKSGNQQSSESSGISENNKTSNVTSPDDEAKNPTLTGRVVKMDGNKITIIKEIKKDNKTGSIAKTGVPAATKNMVTFEVDSKTAVIVETVFDQGIKSTDTTGSISDIKEYSIVDVSGNKDEDNIIATKVIVYIFK